jgi:hypothetical protein
MTADELKNLLQYAEPALPGAPQGISPAALVSQARQRRVRRAAMRSAAAAIAVGLIATPLLILRSNQPDLAAHSPPARVHIPTPDLATIDVEPVAHEYALELVQLERAAAMQSEILRRVLADTAADDAAAADAAESFAASALSDADLFRAETARSAALSLQYAVLAERELHDLATPPREYERVAQRFPGTEWAEVAAVSLERLKPIDPMPL